MYQGNYNIYFEVNLNSIKENCKKVKEHAKGKKIIHVMKGNCYGHGMVDMAKFFTEECGAETLAVAHLIEAIRLREAGIKCNIVIIAAIPIHLIDEAISNDVQLMAYNEDVLKLIDKKAKEKGKKVKVHIKINTGLNRLGVSTIKELDSMIDCIKGLSSIDPVGISTHFATSTESYQNPFTLEQYGKFKVLLAHAQNERKMKFEYIHCCNSSSMTWLDDTVSNHVRNCSAPLGYVSMEDGTEPIGLQEPSALRTFITNIRTVEPGESVGYGRAFKPEKTTIVATVAFGHADGIYPDIGRKGGSCIVNGIKTKFVGMCMDQSFVDVTGIDCNIGDQVTLLGKDGDQKITTYEMEQFTGHTFEYLYGVLGTRVDRVYVK